MQNSVVGQGSRCHFSSPFILSSPLPHHRVHARENVIKRFLSFEESPFRACQWSWRDEIAAGNYTSIHFFCRREGFRIPAASRAHPVAPIVKTGCENLWKANGGWWKWWCTIESGTIVFFLLLFCVTRKILLILKKILWKSCFYRCKRTVIICVVLISFNL